MKLKIASVALFAVAVSTGAYAEPSTVLKEDPGKSRADVQAELHAYQRNGVNPWSTNYNPLRHVKSGLSREEVVSDYIASRKEVAAINGEDSGSAYFKQPGGGTNAR